MRLIFHATPEYPEKKRPPCQAALMCPCFLVALPERNLRSARQVATLNPPYNVDSISKPHASSSASGMYFEFLFRRAHSRKRVDRTY